MGAGPLAMGLQQPQVGVGLGPLVEIDIPQGIASGVTCRDSSGQPHKIGSFLHSPVGALRANGSPTRRERGNERVPLRRNVTEHFDVLIRAPDRLRGAWEASGDIIDLKTGKSIARVYGVGRTSAGAAEEVDQEAHRWIHRNIGRR